MGSALGQSCPLRQREKGYAGILRVCSLVLRQPDGAGTGAERGKPGLGWFLGMALPGLESPTLKATETLRSLGFMCDFHAGLKPQLQM